MRKAKSIVGQKKYINTPFYPSAFLLKLYVKEFGLKLMGIGPEKVLHHFLPTSTYNRLDTN